MPRLVTHKIIPKDLKILHPITHISNTGATGHHSLSARFLRLLEQLRKPSSHGSFYFLLDILVNLLLIESHLIEHIVEGKNVSFFELAVCFAVFLDCVVGEMSVLAIVVYVEFHAGSSDVAFFEEK